MVNNPIKENNPKKYQTFTFSAKEKDSETGFSYFGSRYYSSDLSIWLSVDPQASKYPSLSPYVYCANNPIKLVDPNGEEIDPESMSLWKNMRSFLMFERNIVGICKDIEMKTNGMLCRGSIQKYNSIDKTLSTMEKMETSDQKYKLSECTGNISNVSFDNTDKSISISFSGTEGFIHEITHCAQFERGDIGFGPDGRALTDIYDELEAYTNQAAYNYKSLPGNLMLKPLTDTWLLNIYDGKNFPYRNCGLIPIGAKSTAEDMNQAYPPGGFNFTGTVSSELYFKTRK